MMINLKTIEGDILETFLSTLRQRVKVDPSFLEQDMISQLSTQITDNLEAKGDLFEMLKLDNDEEIKRKSLDIRQSKDLESEPVDQMLEGQRSQIELQTEKDQLESDEWQKQYEEHQNLTEKVQQLSKKAINLHISGIYEQKTHKYIPKKDQHRLHLGPLLLKTATDEYLVPKMSCSLSRGNKTKVLELSQSLLEQKQAKDYSQDEIMLLVDQILDD